MTPPLLSHPNPNKQVGGAFCLCLLMLPDERDALSIVSAGGLMCGGNVEKYATER